MFPRIRLLPEAENGDAIVGVFVAKVN